MPHFQLLLVIYTLHSIADRQTFSIRTEYGESHLNLTSSLACEQKFPVALRLRRFQRPLISSEVVLNVTVEKNRTTKRTGKPMIRNKLKIGSNDSLYIKQLFLSFGTLSQRLFAYLNNFQKLLVYFNSVFT